MKTFALTPEMQTIGGVFYPTGYALVMFPTADDAQAAGEELQAVAAVTDERPIQHITPQAALHDIGHSEDGSDIPLPSVGTEGATARAVVELARQGHHGLLVPASSREEAESVMEVARRHRFSFAQKYRRLVIEDLK